MLFISHVFLFYFLPFALLLYYALYAAPTRLKNLSPALLGYVFPGWANPKFVPLMLATTLLDWMVRLVL